MFPTHDKLVLYENEEARLRCYADVPSTPRSRWITPNGTTLTYNESILILNVSTQHAGLYTCEAENSYGTATRSVNVTVKSREYLFCDVTALFLSILLCLILIQYPDTILQKPVNFFSIRVSHTSYNPFSRIRFENSSDLETRLHTESTNSKAVNDVIIQVFAGAYNISGIIQ